MPNPNTVGPSRRPYLETIFYLLLLFFIVPLKIDDPNSDEAKYQKYLQDFNKSYENSTTYQQRLQAFKRSLEQINNLNLNRTNGTAKYGLTKFSDLFPEEFLHSKHSPDHKINVLWHTDTVETANKSSLERIKRSALKFNIPQKVDWRQKNAVTKVQSQEGCGACWAFAVIGMVEALYSIRTGKLESFSVQEMIDCSKNNDGCKGGDVCSLLRWMKTFKIDVAKENDYPLTLKTQKCQNVSKTGVHIQDYECHSFVNSEDVILALIAKNGPVAVAINAKTWQNYIGGTIQFHCSGGTMNLNHAVTIVGYDLTSEIPHYIVKNSWGEDFGDNGYLYITIGSNACGLAEEVAAIKL